MNKAELIQQLEGRLGSKKAAAEALNAVVDIIERQVAKGEKVSITGFGTFEKVTRAARKGRNPRTGESVRIKRTSVPKFRPGATFKGYVADPKSLPKPEKPVKAAAKPVTKAVAKAAAATKAAPAKKSATKAVTAKKTVKATPAKAATTKTATKATTKKAAPAKAATAKKTTTKKAATKRAASK